MAEFEKAHQAFLAQLSDEEKQQFRPVKDYATFQTEVVKLSQSAKSRKFTKIFTGINKCGKSLASYFEVVGIVVQSHPEWAALAWGSFRLILVLASNYMSFFEKLENVFERLNRSIPVYQELSALFQRLNAEVNVSSEFSSSLQAFYVDLLEIFRGIARIFTKKTGKLRSNPVVVGQLLWQPFEVRFSDILQRLESHQGILRFEMDAIQLRTTTTIALTQKEESQRADLLAVAIEQRLQAFDKLINRVKLDFSNAEKQTLKERIASWIDPTPFADTYERLSDLRLEGTAEWIFQTKEYMDWASASSTNNFLWIRANPGAGKSVLAASIVEELLHTISTTDEEPLTTYFFFEYSRADATTNELLDLLRILSPRIHNWSIVIDAIDECNEANELSEDLNSVFKGSSTKVLLISRPNVSFLRHSMPREQILSVSRLNNQEDLRAYFELYLDRFQRLGAIPKSANIPSLVEALLLSADGMFQWARLMVTHLSSDGLSPRQRLDIIGSLRNPENLDDMYERILAFLSKKLLSERQLARSIFLWVHFAKKPLSAIQLQDILTPYNDTSQGKDEWVKRTDDESLTDFETSTILVTGGLVEKRGSQYTFIHGSVQDFFDSRCGIAEPPHDETSHSTKYFLPHTCQAHLEMTNACLLYICRTIPRKPLAGDMFKGISAIALEDLRPFVNYAALYWPHHLCSTNISRIIENDDSTSSSHWGLETLLKTLERFLSSTFMPMVWVELMYTFDDTNHGHFNRRQTLRCWALSVGDLTANLLATKFKMLSAAILELTGHLENLHELWGNTLIRSPNKIWHDITAFSPNPFFVTTRALKVNPLESDHPSVAETIRNPLVKISRDHPGTGLLAILQIWPPEGFKDMPTGTHFDFSGPDRFNGWTAQYEIWSIMVDSPVVIERSHILLNPQEVQLQYDTFKVATSLNGTVHNMSIHFPTSIGEDLKRFTILTTLYRRRKPLPLASERPTSVDATDMWVSTTIPIKNTIHAPMLMRTWRSTQEGVIGNAFVNQLAYSTSSFRERTPTKLPWYEIKSYNDYIIYQSNEGCGTLNEDEGTRGTLAVYHVGHEAEDNAATLLGTVECNGHFGNMSLATLHPYRLLLAFFSETRSGTHSRLVLWQLNVKIGIRPEYLHLDSALFRLSLAGSNGSLTSIPSPPSLSSLQFDSSGELLIYRHKGASYPSTLNITSFKIYQECQMWNQKQISGQELAQSSPATTNTSNDEVLVPVDSRSTEVLKLGESRFDAEGSSISLSLDSKAARSGLKNLNRDLTIQYSNGESRFQQEILSLPGWNDAEHISASVYPSLKTHDDKIMVVLNKTAKRVYELDDKVKPTPPMIVRKDKRAIERPKLGRSLPGHGPTKRNAISWVHDYQLFDEDEPSTKKLRYSPE